MHLLDHDITRLLPQTSYVFVSIVQYQILVKLTFFHHCFVGYQICGVLAKLLFVGNLNEAHLGIFESMNIQLSALKLANTTRRNFLRYVFHEVNTYNLILSSEVCAHEVVRDRCM